MFVQKLVFLLLFFQFQFGFCFDGGWIVEGRRKSRKVLVFWDDRDIGIGFHEGTMVQEEGWEMFVSTKPPRVGRSAWHGGEEKEEEDEEEGDENGGETWCELTV